MAYVANSNVRCPLDRLPLLRNADRLSCSEGHSFDIARQGYVNLLGSRDKRSRDPGDSKAMIAARRSFLEAGYYRELAVAVAEQVRQLLKEEDDTLLLDAGCGEGYYLQQLIQELGSTPRALPSIVGFDISKWAVQAAARRFDATWLVASSRNIPLADASVELLLCLFGFPDYPSFDRVLKDGGQLLLLEAGPRHLVELRELIYPRLKEAKPRDWHLAEVAGLRLVDTRCLQFNTRALDKAAIAQLLLMTPHLFRASHEGKQKASALTEIVLTVDARIHLLEKSSPEI